MHKHLHPKRMGLLLFICGGYPSVSVDGYLHFYIILLVCAQEGTEKDVSSSVIKQINKCGCFRTEIFCFSIVIKSRYVSQSYLDRHTFTLALN